MKPVLVQVLGASAAVLLIAHRFFRTDIASSQRKATIFLCCLGCTIGAIAAKSTAVTTQNFILVARPLNFVLAFVRLQFRAAAVLTGLSVAADILTILLCTDMPWRAKTFPIGVVLILCLPGLAALPARTRDAAALSIWPLAAHEL